MACDRVLCGTTQPTLRSIPRTSLLEARPPVVFASRLALREGNSKKPIYQIHKWWARRLGSVFRSILLSATSPANTSDSAFEQRFYGANDLSGLVVLDPFVGGGTSVVEAAKCKASVIGVDIDPVACFVTGRVLAPVRQVELQRAFSAVKRLVREQILAYYTTVLPDGRNGLVQHAFWVERITCPHCQQTAPAHPHYQLRRNQRARKQVVFCCHCGEIHHLPLHRKNFECRACKSRTTIEQGNVAAGRFTCPACDRVSPTSPASPKNPPRHDLFALEVIVGKEKKRVFKKADKADLALFRRAVRDWDYQKARDRVTPKERIPVRARVDNRPVSFAYTHYQQLFNGRQLLSLSLIAKTIRAIPAPNVREFLALAFSDCLAANNLFCYYAFDYQKLTPLFGLHAYHKVTRPVENNVWGTGFGRGTFEKCFEKLLRGKRYGAQSFEYRYSSGKNPRPKQMLTGEFIKTSPVSSVPANRGGSFFLILNQSSENLNTIPKGSVDLVLSDPPYYDNLAYSELSDFYHVWLKRLRLPNYRGRGAGRTPLKESLYVKTRLEKEHYRFQFGLKQVFGECARVLKDAGLLVFTFHHREPKAWEALAWALSQSNFRITNVFPVRSEGQSQFHSSDGNLKWDAVFCCRKSTSAINTRVTRGRNTNAVPAALAQRWRRVLKRARLDFGKADFQSLKAAIRAMHLCNAALELRTSRITQ